MEVVLEGTQIVSESDLHRVLSEQLDFGPYYGNNLAALWDRLTKDVERPICLIWRNAAHSQRALGEPAFEKIVRLFRDVELQDQEFGYPEQFVFRCESSHGSPGDPVPRT